MDTETPTIKSNITIRVERLAHGLRSAAIFLEMVAIVAIVSGTILGVVIAAQKSSTTDAFGTSSGTHPYVITGVGTVIGTAVGGILYWCIARSLRLFAEHVAISHDVDLDSGLSVFEDDEDDEDEDDEDDEGEQRDRSSKRCPSCDAEIEALANFCSLCGDDVTASHGESHA